MQAQTTQRRRLILTAAVLLPTATLSTIVSSTKVLAQATPANGGRVAQPTQADAGRVQFEYSRARDRLVQIRRNLERAQRDNLPGLHDEAVADFKRVLEQVEPSANLLSADVPEQRLLRNEYNSWVEEYRQAVGVPESGAFFMWMSNRWSTLTAPAAGWEQEQPTAVRFEQILAQPEDPAARHLGMPKTVALAQAVTRYLSEVRSHESYSKFEGLNDVSRDLAQAEAGRTTAYQKLVPAAERLLNEAGAANLDNAGRDRLERFVEVDLAEALAGYPGLPALQSRGYRLVTSYDTNHGGAASAAERASARLMRAAERNWPQILATYQVRDADPRAVGRGELVHVRGLPNRIGRGYRAADYDFIGEVNGMPVAAKFDPALREQVKSVLEQTNTTALPPETMYEMVGVVRGLAQVDVLRQASPSNDTPGNQAAVAAAGDETAAPATRPTYTAADAVVLDVVALRAGAVSVGVQPSADALRAGRVRQQRQSGVAGVTGNRPSEQQPTQIGGLQGGRPDPTQQAQAGAGVATNPGSVYLPTDPITGTPRVAAGGEGAIAETTPQGPPGSSTQPSGAIGTGGSGSGNGTGGGNNGGNGGGNAGSGAGGVGSTGGGGIPSGGGGATGSGGTGAGPAAGTTGGSGGGSAGGNTVGNTGSGGGGAGPNAGTTGGSGGGSAGGNTIGNTGSGGSGAGPNAGTTGGSGGGSAGGNTVGNTGSGGGGAGPNAGTTGGSGGGSAGGNTVGNTGSGGGGAGPNGGTTGGSGGGSAGPNTVGNTGTGGGGAGPAAGGGGGGSGSGSSTGTGTGTGSGGGGTGGSSGSGTGSGSGGGSGGGGGTGAGAGGSGGTGGGGTGGGGSGGGSTGGGGTGGGAGGGGGGGGGGAGGGGGGSGG